MKPVRSLPPTTAPLSQNRFPPTQERCLRRPSADRRKLLLHRPPAPGYARSLQAEIKCGQHGKTATICYSLFAVRCSLFARIVGFLESWVSHPFACLWRKGGNRLLGALRLRRPSGG